MNRYVVGGIQLALTVIWYLSSTSEGPVLAINPLVIAGIGLATNLLGNAFGDTSTQQSSSTQFDPATIRRILNAIRTARGTSFVPDEGAFNAQADADIEDILAQIPVGEEALEAEFASRGTNVSPGTVGALIREVRAPAIRAAGSVRAQSRLNFQRAKIAGTTAQNQVLNQLYQILAGITNRTTTGQSTGPNQLGAGFADIGQFAFEFGLGEQFGLFGEEQA